jgi:hypothetical protein
MSGAGGVDGKVDRWWHWWEWAATVAMLVVQISIIFLSRILIKIFIT